MKKLLLAAVALAALSLPANALLIKDLGNNPNSATGHFSNSVLGTTFDDQYLFHLVGNQFITFASATNDYTQVSDFISNFTGQLFSTGADGAIGGTGANADVAIGPLVNAVACTQNPTGCQILAGSALLAGGNYFLDIKGTGGGTSGYGGDLTVSLSAVPVPGAVWLFGTGLAGLGALRLRRRRAAQQVA